MSTATFAHIGDFHAAPGARDVDRYAALDRIIDEADQGAVDAFLWPGDLFDAAADAHYVNALDTRLVRMAHLAPVIILYGNHDRPGYLDGFARLKAPHRIYVVDQPEVLTAIACANGVQASIFCLPYPHKAGLVAQGVAPADVGEQASRALERICQQGAQELETARARGDLTLLIGHINVGGAIVSTGQPNIGREIELAPAHLDLFGPIYKGLNHIHKPQEIHGAWYAGSVCRLNWGEVEAKRYLRVTAFHNPNSPIGQSAHVESVPLPVPPRYDVEGTLTREGFAYHVRDDVAPPGDAVTIDWTGVDVRVRYTFAQSETSVLDHAGVRAQFAGARILTVEPQAVIDHQLRAPAVAQAVTLPEKLAAYTGAPLRPSVVEKLAQLEHADAAAVLLTVAARVVAIQTEEGSPL